MRHGRFQKVSDEWLKESTFRLLVGHFSFSGGLLMPCEHLLVSTVPVSQVLTRSSMKDSFKSLLDFQN